MLTHISSCCCQSILACVARMLLPYFALGISPSAQGCNQSLKDKASDPPVKATECPVPRALGGRLLCWVGMPSLQQHQQVVMGGCQQLLPRRRRCQTSWDLEFTPDGFCNEWAGFDLRLWFIHNILVDICNWPRKGRGMVLGFKRGSCSRVGLGFLSTIWYHSVQLHGACSPPGLLCWWPSVHKRRSCLRNMSETLCLCDINVEQKKTVLISLI